MKTLKKVLLISVCVSICFAFSQISNAQYWQTMPPYNMLWPLWTETLIKPLTETLLEPAATLPLITEFSLTTTPVSATIIIKPVAEPIYAPPTPLNPLMLWPTVVMIPTFPY